jgi:hypothetical protein
MQRRPLLYWLARLLGDWQAIRRGRVRRRIARRAVGRLTGGRRGGCFGEEAKGRHEGALKFPPLQVRCKVEGESWWALVDSNH